MVTLITRTIILDPVKNKRAIALLKSIEADKKELMDKLNADLEIWRLKKLAEINSQNFTEGEKGRA